MIELFKIIKGMYYPTCVPHFDFTELSETPLKGNRYQLNQHHCHYDLRKYTYTNHVIPVWSSLSDYVVSVETVNIFKRRLDKFWSDQDVLCNYKADLLEIVNRSTIV